MASEDRVVVTGRVILVNCREDGKFDVMFGAPTDVSWAKFDSPPPLGGLVVVQASEKKTQDLPDGAGKVSLLSGDVKAMVDASRPPVRVVPPSLLAIVDKAMRRKLLPYQSIGAAWMVDRLLQSKGVILADDPGLGKTTQTVATICAMKLFPAVIVCPSSLKLNWPKEFKHSVADPKVTVIDGRSGPFKKADVYVVNYGVLRARENDIGNLRPACLVFDEAHELKEHNAGPRHRAAVSTRLAHYVRRVIALTGSPLMNHPREFWRLLHMVDPQEWPEFDRFDLRYLRPQLQGTMAKNVVTSRGRAENVEELRARTQVAMLRRRKDEVAEDLPQKNVRSLLVRLDPPDQLAYDEAERDVVAWLMRLGQGKRAQAAAKTIGFAKLTMLRRIAAVGKLRRAVPLYLRAWFEAENPSPLVVFGYHRSVLSAVKLHAKRLGIRSVGIEGSDDPQKRQSAVDQFQRGKADLFICPIRAGGVGINLQRASDSLFLERDWSPATLLQAEDRIHRLGQIRPVTITYVDAKGTVDEHVADIVEAKRKLIHEVIDGGGSDAESQQIVDDLLKRLSKKSYLPKLTSNG